MVTILRMALLLILFVHYILESKARSYSEFGTIGT